MENDAVKYAIDRIDEEVYAFDTDGVLQYVNEQVRDRYGLRLEDDSSHLGRINSQLVGEQFAELLEKLDENSGRYRLITQHTLPDGSTFPLQMILYKITDPNGKQIVWVYARDLSDMLSQQRKISELSSIMTVFMDNSPLHLYAKRASDGTYLYWNRAMSESLRIPRSKAIGMTDEQIFPRREDIEKIRDVDSDLILNGGTIEILQDLQYPSGEIHTVRSIKTLIRSNDFEPMIVGVNIDITDMKTAERELINGRMEVERSDRLRGALISDLGSEMREGLDAIIESIRSQNGADSGKLNDKLETLCREVDEVVDISSLSAGRTESTLAPFSVGDLCSGVYEQLRGRMPEGLELQFERPSDDLLVEGDRVRLKQVLSSIITVAVSYIRTGYIRFSYRYVGGHLEMKIVDDGSGEAREDLSVIFLRYARQDSYSGIQGNHLRMMLNKTMIERMGGSMTIISSKDTGSIFTFTVDFPKVDDTPVKTPEASAAFDIPSNPSPDGKKNVLVAEDVDSNYQLLQALIGRDYDLRRANTGLEALDVFKEQNFSPDIVLMDMKMPVMGGLEATRAIRKISATVPIIALTANAFDDDREEALAAGCNEFLTKPITADILRKTIDKYTSGGI